MAAIVALLNAAATLAFGAVYPWGYLPLFCAAALIGGIGAVRYLGSRSKIRALAIGLLAVALTASVQLAPLPRGVLDAISPKTRDVLRQYNLTFAGDDGRHAVSIDPAATALAVGSFAALGLYLVGLAAALSGSALRALPHRLLLFGVPLALLGIASREWSNSLVLWFWKPQAGGTDAFGPFVNRNHFAGWMLMALCLALGSLLGQIEHAGNRRAVGRGQSSWAFSSEASIVVLTAIGIVVMAIALVWTLSRSAIVALVVAIGFLAWLVTRRQRVAGMARLLALASVALVLVVGVSWRGAGLIVRWFGDTRDFEGRLAAWHDGWRVFKDFPWAGTGLNTFGTAMLFYQQSNSGLHLGSAHNDYLQLLVEGGVLVVVPSILAIGMLVYVIRQNLKAASNESRGYWIRAGAAVGLVAIAVQEAAEFSLQIPANAFLCCTLAAIALAPAGGSRASGTFRA